MPDREKEYIVEKLQESLEKAENDGCIYAKIRRPIVFSTIAMLKEQEAATPTWGRGKPFCGACGLRIRGGKFCSECGRQIAWEGR